MDAREAEHGAAAMGDEDDDWEPCPRGCESGIPSGKADTCPVCDGRGATLKPDPRGLIARIADGEEAPAWWDACGEVLMARAGIAQYGVDGWMRLAGIKEPHPDLMEWLAVIECEMGKRRQAEMVAQAKKRKK